MRELPGVLQGPTQTHPHLHTDSPSLPLTKAPRFSQQTLPLDQIPGGGWVRLLGRSDPPSCNDSLSNPSTLDPLGKQMCLWSKCGKTPGRQQVIGPWRWASRHCGPLRLLREPSPQDSGEMGEGPTCLPWHACSSALPSAVCQLCPFPDPTFGEILRSCLNHFLSRPHFQLWESGPGQQPGAFCTLPMGCYPLSSSLWPGPFFDFIGS